MEPIFPAFQQIQPEVPQGFAKISVPPHRLTPLRENWEEIVSPIIQHMKLQIRMNTRLKRVQLRTCNLTQDRSALSKSSDFVRAFMCGFQPVDALALLRLEDIALQSFQIKDVKTLQGQNLSRCIGRLAGEKGRTKNAIQNSTRTRIILADSKIHIMGSHANIKQARRAICNLILGKTPGKVYSQLRAITKRMKERSQKQEIYIK